MEVFIVVKRYGHPMKAPCELIVWYVLPSIRRELAKELVENHSLTQAEVARRFGVTDAAISQYLKSKRGTSKEIENSEKYPEFKEEVEKAAVRMVNGSDIVTETCAICDMIKRSGMLCRIYQIQIGEKAPERIWCDSE